MDGDDVRTLALPLEDPGDFDPLLDRVAGARIVMIGEASHGTHDFYRWRCDLTQRLIAEQGFSFVAVEGDWPDCDRVDRAVRCRPGGESDPRTALARFDRWPTWMWANEEVSDFCRWLQAWNVMHRIGAGDGGPAVGFHGLDVYSLWESLREIISYLREHDPAAVPAALGALHCLDPYGEDPQAYAIAARQAVSCGPSLAILLAHVREQAAAEAIYAIDHGGDATGLDPFRAFDLRQNAEAAAGAEAYYRAMVASGPESWNIRDLHMLETLDRLLTYYDRAGGEPARAIVWAHNTHVGDARATDMADVGMVNLGQLGRQRWGEDAVFLIGFGSHRGHVVAGPSWGAPMEVMPLPPARPGSLEAMLDADVPDRALFLMPENGLPAWLADELPHRAVGVVYRPDREAYGNYVPTRLGRRYDAFLWCPSSTALRPFAAFPAHGELETFPVGV